MNMNKLWMTSTNKNWKGKCRSRDFIQSFFFFLFFFLKIEKCIFVGSKVSYFSESFFFCLFVSFFLSFLFSPPLSLSKEIFFFFPHILTCIILFFSLYFSHIFILSLVFSHILNILLIFTKIFFFNIINIFSVYFYLVPYLNFSFLSMQNCINFKWGNNLSNIANAFWRGKFQQIFSSNL